MVIAIVVCPIVAESAPSAPAAHWMKVRVLRVSRAALISEDQAGNDEVIGPLHRCRRNVRATGPSAGQSGPPKTPKPPVLREFRQYRYRDSKPACYGPDLALGRGIWLATAESAANRSPLRNARERSAPVADWQSTGSQMEDSGSVSHLNEDDLPHPRHLG
jgi:hypothetical protein